MLTLVYGGAGSGKSALAEKICCSLPRERVYLATMQAHDAESLARVTRHREQRRGMGFRTLELPCGLAKAAVRQDDNILLEDLSNLLANEMFAENGGGEEAVWEGIRHLLISCAHLTVVTNEVFTTGACYGDSTLQYLKSLAALNRGIASIGDLVIEAVCGLPNVLKGALPW